MKTFKQLDAIIQVLVLIGIACINLFKKTIDIDNDFFVISYFIVGSVQLLSVLVHFFISPLYKIGLRKTYLWLLGFIFLLGIITFCLDQLKFTNESIFLFLAGLLYFSPLMAILYVIVVSLEYKRIKASFQ